MMGHPFHSSGYTEEAATNPRKGWEIHEGTFTLPMYLNQRGYETYLVDSAHTSKRTLGHRHRRDHPDPDGASGGARNIADVMESVFQEEANTDGPFYAEANISNAHTPFSNREGGFKDNPIPGYESPAPEEVDLSPYFPEGVEAAENFDDFGDAHLDTEGFKEAAVRRNFAALYEDIYELDYAVGQMLDALGATGQREDTLFILVADHGIPHDFPLAPNVKGTNYDGGIEAAMVMHYPGHVEGGDRYDMLTSHVDIVPTVLDLVDGNPPAEVDGRSLRPLIDSADDRRYEQRDAVFTEKTYFGDYDPVRGIRTEEYKLLRNFWFHNYPNAERNENTEVELYDLKEDPMETTNVATDPAYKDVREELYERLGDRLERDNDPILDGPIPPKEGAFDVRM